MKYLKDKNGEVIITVLIIVACIPLFLGFYQEHKIFKSDFKQKAEVEKKTEQTKK